MIAALKSALDRVQDPDLHQGLVTLNMVRNLAFADGGREAGGEPPGGEHGDRVLGHGHGPWIGTRA